MAKVNGVTAMNADTGKPLTANEMATTIYNGMSRAARNAIPAPTKDNAQEFYSAMLEFDPACNEFLTSMINRIAWPFYRSVIVNNPYDRFYKGTIGTGFNIQDVFVDLFNEKITDFDPQSDDVDNIFKRQTPPVYTLYYSVNFEKHGKITVQQDIMARAFANEDWSGLNGLVEYIVRALNESIRQVELDSQTAVLANAIMGGYLKPIAVNGLEAGKLDKTKLEDDVAEMKAVMGEMDFTSRDYNFYGVMNRSSLDDLYLLVTPRFMAYNDVKVMASAFNMGKVEFLSHVVVIPNFGAAKNVEAVLVDKDFFQFYRNLTKTTQIYNPSSLFWNYFQTETAVFATSMFSNAVVFTSKEAVIASVTITAGQKAAKGKATPIKYTISLDGSADDGCFYNKCTWSITGANSSRTKINPAGILEIGKDETASTISVTATSVQDPTKTSTVNVTVTA